MNRCRVLFDSAFVVVKRFDHPADVPHEDPDETTSDTYSVNFLDRGSFSVSWDGGTAVVGGDTVLVTSPGSVYRCRHGEQYPNDAILGIALRDRWVDAFRGAGAEEVPPRLVKPMSGQQWFLRRRLGSQLRAGSVLSVENIAAELLGSVCLPPTGRSQYRARTRFEHLRHVAAARELLDVQYAGSHSLTSLAAGVGMSPFHFARVFRELTGTPPHRYLIRRRLGAATDYLTGGMSVTETCFAVGFENLSHFIRSFHRTYGVTPSKFAETGGRTGPERR